jgi:hypothetical protein
MDGVLKLYEDCLRSEEGIRYRRNFWAKSLNKLNDRSEHYFQTLSNLLKHD